ncbi:MAG TPA: alpha/beta hydrolase [Candidatus Xenobia bacterium]|jgi:acetyl esterase/lipase
MDIVYARPGGVEVKLDLYLPVGPCPFPVVILVHGGGWHKGDKALPAHPRSLRAFRGGDGFALASVNYRLSPRYKFPACIEDVKAAVRFLRAHAAEYHLDPHRFAAWGLSAGGHLVGLLGLADRSAGWDVGDHLDQSSAVQAVAEWYGGNDLQHFLSPAGRQGIQETFLPQDLARGSPITWVQRRAPPFFIVQGEEDVLVPAAQARLLADRLRHAGVPVTLVLVRHAGHGLRPVGGSPDPPLTSILSRQWAFFRRTLQPMRSKGPADRLEKNALKVNTVPFQPW